KDPRFPRNADRVRICDILVGKLGEHCQGDTADKWVKRIHALKVPVGVINDIGRALDEPQVVARDMLVEIPHAQNPSFRMVGSPLKLSETPVEYQR
ncbi:CoA transferase, partial [Pseudomonas aeruginosa]